MPFKAPDADRPHNNLFNELFSRARVVIEHVNGMLKMRWMSLKGIRIQVKEEKDFKAVCEHIIVCLILHNLMCDFDDEWDEEFEMDEEAQQGDEEENDLDDEMSGQELRARVRNYVLQWHFDQN